MSLSINRLQVIRHMFNCLVTNPARRDSALLPWSHISLIALPPSSFAHLALPVGLLMRLPIPVYLPSILSLSQHAVDSCILILSVKASADCTCNGKLIARLGSTSYMIVSSLWRCSAGASCSVLRHYLGIRITKHAA